MTKLRCFSYKKVHMYYRSQIYIPRECNLSHNFIVHGVVSNGKNENVHILKPNCIVFTALNYIFEVVLFIVNLSFSKELWRKIALEGWTVVAIYRLYIPPLNKKLCFRYYCIGKSSNLKTKLLFFTKNYLMAQILVFESLR